LIGLRGKESGCPGELSVGDQQRRQHRIGVSLELRIRGRDVPGFVFEESTQSHDVSRGGCSFETTHEVAVGAELDIEILRHYGLPFTTTGQVLRATRAGPGRYTLGVRFTGPQFPTYSSEITN
jgi:hypothetical protein